jgi:hypothetical protein
LEVRKHKLAPGQVNAGFSRLALIFGPLIDPGGTNDPSRNSPVPRTETLEALHKRAAFAVRELAAGRPQRVRGRPRASARRRVEAEHSVRPTRSTLWIVSRAELDTLIELQRELAALHSWTRPSSRVGRPRQALRPVVLAARRIPDCSGGRQLSAFRRRTRGKRSRDAGSFRANAVASEPQGAKMRCCVGRVLKLGNSLQTSLFYGPFLPVRTTAIVNSVRCFH